MYTSKISLKILGSKFYENVFDGPEYVMCRLSEAKTERHGENVSLKFCKFFVEHQMNIFRVKKKETRKADGGKPRLCLFVSGL